MGRPPIPLWARLAFVALPAVVAAALAVYLSPALSGSLAGGAGGADAISPSLHELARRASRYAVLAGAPASAISLAALLLAGERRRYPAREEADALVAVLGRVAAGCALLAGAGLASQLVLVASANGWGP